MDHDDDALPIGTLLADEYRIDGVLGAGGFGITYRARDVKLEIDVAIKEYFPRDFASRANTTRTVRPRTRTDAEQFEWGLTQFIEEARRLARLQHPNIVRCMRYFEENDTGYFVMTFEEGDTLERYFPKPPRQDELDRILTPLLDALEALHAAGIYHRDISPDNILIRHDDTPVLIDFGASRQSLARRTQTMAAIVKPGYSPIEQYDRETRQQGAWSDIYALGATLYSVIAGGPPPDALARVRSDSYVPAREAARGAYRSGFLDAIDWAVEVDPDHRPVTIREWRRKLLPNPSGRPATAATRFEPHGGGVRTLATRFFGKTSAPPKEVESGSADTPLAKPDGGLRWPDYVLRGAVLVVLAVFVLRVFGGDGTSPEASPEHVMTGAAEERQLDAVAKAPEQTWKRVELVLRRLGYLRTSGTATLSDLRESLKGYQHAIGEPRTGALNQTTLNRIMEEGIELDPYTVPGAVAIGRWFLERNPEQKGCRITAGTSRIEGRTLLTERPILEFGRPRDYTEDSVDMAFAKPQLFDTSAAISLSAGTNHHMLFVHENDIVVGKTTDGSWSREPMRALRNHRGEVIVNGTSAYRGTLKLAFPTDGFERAFRIMAEDCGEGILYWIDDWGAVVKDQAGTLWHSMVHGNEGEAKQATMSNCLAKSTDGGCEHYVAFKETCFAASSGDRGESRHAVYGWATNPDLETAKRNAVDACAEDGATNCALFMHICADNSNYWSVSQE